MILEKEIEEGAKELENNVGILASISALELDNLLNNHPYDLEAIDRLVKKISEFMTLPDKSKYKNYPLICLIDPFLMTVMNKTMISLGYYEPGQTVQTVVDETKKITTYLQKVYNDNLSREVDINDAKQMREFCLTLSRKARAYNYLR